jgi:hypothetical protein
MDSAEWTPQRPTAWGDLAFLSLSLSLLSSGFSLLSPFHVPPHSFGRRRTCWLHEKKKHGKRNILDKIGENVVENSQKIFLTILIRFFLHQIEIGIEKNLKRILIFYTKGKYPNIL